MAEFEDIERTLSHLTTRSHDAGHREDTAEHHHHRHDNLQAVYVNPHAEDDEEQNSTSKNHVADKNVERDLELGIASDKHLESGGEAAAESGRAGGQASATTTTAGDKEEGSEGKDPYKVDWDGDDDPENPRNWAKWLKLTNIGIVSAVTFLTPLASSMFAPAIPEVLQEFKITSSFLGSFVVSIYLLGFAFGPIVLAPLSETIGRRWIYVVCNFLFVIFTIACGESTNMGMLIAFRFLAGCVGAAPLTIGAGSISDICPPETRGVYMAGFAMGPIIGPVVGPVAGGYLADAKGFRWVFHVIAILAAAISILSLAFLRETYPPVLLEQKAKKLNKEHNTDKYVSVHHNPLPLKELFIRALVRPIKMLASPIIFFLSVFMAVIYGYLYLLFTTFYLVFQGNYGFATGTVGLTFVGVGIGSVIGLVIVGIVSDKLYVYLKKKNNGVSKPEFRLPPMVYGSVSIPIGLFMYGWTAEKHVHWIAPIIGTSFVGLGLMVIFMPVSTYLIDAYTKYAASAMAANTIFRSIVGAFLPLAGESLYRDLGVGWGNSLLGFIAVAMIPIPIIFNRYGERIRNKYKFNFD